MTIRSFTSIVRSDHYTQPQTRNTTWLSHILVVESQVASLEEGPDPEVVQIPEGDRSLEAVEHLGGETPAVEED